MSEYNMTHTGKELDDAIAKVQSGYVFPDQAVTVTENGIYDTIKNIPVKMLDEIEVAVPVPDGYEIPTLYTGDYNVTSNQTLQTAGKKLTSNLTVNVPVPSGYVKLSEILNHCTRTAGDTYTVGSSNTVLNKVSIPVADENGSFKPKVFVIFHSSRINNTGTSNTSIAVTGAVTVANDTGTILYKHSSGIYYQSGLGGVSNQSSSRYFKLIDGGVQGVGGDYYMQKSCSYVWKAWG